METGFIVVPLLLVRGGNAVQFPGLGSSVPCLLGLCSGSFISLLGDCDQSTLEVNLMMESTGQQRKVLILLFPFSVSWSVGSYVAAGIGFVSIPV